MNAGGHIAVAAEVAARSGAEPEPGLLLGAALPDLATMGRFRLVNRPASTDAAGHPLTGPMQAEVSAELAGLAAGIGLHHRTDASFHGHVWFRYRHRRLTAELAAAGLGRGPSMACSHVGIELLLDGQLLRHPAISKANVAAFEAIPGLRAQLAGLVRPDERARWLTHLDRLTEWRLPSDYHDPDAVAHRLHRILAARPRLALEARHMPVVAAALTEVKPAIDASAAALVDDLATSLSAPSACR